MAVSVRVSLGLDRAVVHRGPHGVPAAAPRELMAPASVKELLAESNLAFTGSVEEAKATRVPDLPVDDRTVVVRVGEGLHAPPAGDLQPGSTVTVRLAEDLPPLSAGEE